MVERAAHQLAAVAGAAHRLHHRLEPPAQQRRERGEAVVGQVRDRGEDEHERDEEERDRQARWPVSKTSPVWPRLAEAQGSLEYDLAQIKKTPPGSQLAEVWATCVPHGRGPVLPGKEHEG